MSLKRLWKRSAQLDLNSNLLARGKEIYAMENYIVKMQPATNKNIMAAGRGQWELERPAKRISSSSATIRVYFGILSKIEKIKLDACKLITAQNSDIHLNHEIVSTA